MSSITFDTLKFVERLEKAGIPREQAAAQVTVFAEMLTVEDERVNERYSTKQDALQHESGVETKLVQLDAKIDAKFNQLDMKIDKSAAEVKAELIKWVVSVGVLQITIITALLLKLIPQ